VVDPNPLELLSLAERLASEAAALVLDGLTRARSSVTTKSSVTDMVTEMDRAAESVIVAGIRAARPADAIVGEEGTHSDGSSGVAWFVDPIDGTTNYVYALPGFGISIAARSGEQTLVAAVADPLRGDVYTAARGRGAFRNGAEINCSHADRLATALIGTGFSYDSDRRRQQATVLVQVLPLIRDIRRLGAAAVDLCLVASGRLDGFYERGLAPWDKEAGILIATEAGALVEDRPSGLTVVAAPGVFDAFRDLIVMAGADQA
jgi:myo-inositol-1(or 4)-monophosphatase